MATYPGWPGELLLLGHRRSDASRKLAGRPSEPVVPTGSSWRNASCVRYRTQTASLGEQESLACSLILHGVRNATQKIRELMGVGKAEDATTYVLVVAGLLALGQSPRRRREVLWELSPRLDVGGLESLQPARGSYRPPPPPDTSDRPTELFWDIAFLLLGALLLVGGWTSGRGRSLVVIVAEPQHGARGHPTPFCGDLETDPELELSPSSSRGSRPSRTQV
jgi:hypothetical protein